MNKGIGFNRNLRLAWLDATAALCAEVNDPVELRARLDAILGPELTGRSARNNTISLLVTIWLTSARRTRDLREWALAFFQSTTHPEDRVWLHFGLTSLAYPFFWETASIVGRLARQEPTLTPVHVKQRLIAAHGHLGSMNRAVERALGSMRDWGLLETTDRRAVYRPVRQSITASKADLELWLLACMLRVHSAEELPLADLLNLPALFPFHLTVKTGDLRRSSRFETQQQGSGWDSVRLRKVVSA